MTNVALLRLPEVRRLTGLSTASIYARMASGEFPRQVRLGPNSVAWLSSEIEDWIAARTAERDGKSHPEREPEAESAQ